MGFELDLDLHGKRTTQSGHDNALVNFGHSLQQIEAKLPLQLQADGPSRAMWESQMTNLPPAKLRCLSEACNSFQKLTLALTSAIRRNSTRRPSAFTPRPTMTALEQN